MVTSKPLFIADIGIGVGMPQMKKYLKCNLNRVHHTTMNKPKTDYAGYACCVICGLIVGIIFTATLLKVVERKLVHTPSIDKTIKDAYIREDCPTDWISYNNKCIHLSTDRKPGRKDVIHAKL